MEENKPGKGSAEKGEGDLKYSGQERPRNASDV